MQRIKLSQVAFLLLLMVVNTQAAEPALPAKVDPDHAAKMKQGLEVFHAGVRQTLAGRCVKCHGGEKTEGQFDLATREALLKGGASGAAIKIGDSANSWMMKLIRHEDEPSMPEDGAKLPNAQIAAIAKWIELGAPYDKPLVDKNESPDAWITKVVEKSARDFWSFQPLKKSPPPQVVNAAWCVSPIDRFVLAKLEEKKLSPNAPADKRQLIRRVYFDLIGLPPTAAEVEQFVSDSHPQAYKRLIDRLLESPHYGERWGRHWLDVARFAESHGFEQDYDRPFAFHYRDFVIKALNADMPYDQFVRWQLAGDEFEPNNPLAWMATGFLGAGVFPTQLTEKEFESARYDELDDMAATTGTAFLGLTVGCARCHDHKFDPIPTADYYRFVNTFATAIRSNMALSTNPVDDSNALAAWEKEHRPLTAALEKFEKEQLPARFEAWLKQQTELAKTAENQQSSTAPRWMVLEFDEVKSAGGATFTKLEDGSQLVSGKNADFDTYTFVTNTHVQGITAIKLEALADKSFTKQGPGRAQNGNIGLSKITLQAEPLSEKGKAVVVGLKNPQATFQQNTTSLSIASTLDDNPKTGWAVDPQLGKNHAAVFETAEDVGFEAGTKLTITLEFKLNNKHNIGRPRLSLSTAARPVSLDGHPQQQKVAEALAALQKPQGTLNKAQRSTLLKWYPSIDAEWLKLNTPVAAHLEKKPKPQTTQVMVVSEGVKPIPHHADGRGFPHFYKQTFFLKRGSSDQKHGPATQNFLQVLMPAGGNVAGASKVISSLPSPELWQEKPPEDAKSSYRRRALANWATDTQNGAGQLVARVIVNRLWQHHFGQGIVSTPNDFGYQGQRPTHPELLDWLAAQLIEGGWRLKPLHKLMLTSAAYMQNSEYDEADAKLDPENDWLWRFAPKRLEAEVIRDAMLSVTGTLDPTQFGPGTLNEAQKRRSIYFMVKRSRLIPMMQLFDSPEPLVSVGGRPATTIAPQALMFMNNPHVRGYARNFGKQLAADPQQPLPEVVRHGYLTALGRPPSDAELRDTVLFLEKQTELYSAEKQSNARELALTDFCQVLMSLNEFVYVE